MFHFTLLVISFDYLLKKEIPSLRTRAEWLANTYICTVFIKWNKRNGLLYFPPTREVLDFKI